MAVACGATQLLLMLVCNVIALTSSCSFLGRTLAAYGPCWHKDKDYSGLRPWGSKKWVQRGGGVLLVGIIESFKVCKGPSSGHTPTGDIATGEDKWSF